jgi:hypothetical protein
MCGRFTQRYTWSEVALVVCIVAATSDVDFGFNVRLEGSPEDFSVSMGTGT